MAASFTARPRLALWFFLAGVLAVVGVQQAQALGGPSSHAQAFSIDCGSGVTDGGVNGAVNLLSSKGGGYLSIRCDNPSATVVYLGDRDVRGDGTSGYPICTTAATCSDSALTVDTRDLWCAAASTITVRCIVLNNNDL